MPLPLTQELALLAHDPSTGRRHRPGFLEIGLSGAVLVELVLARRLDVTDGRVGILDPAPTGDAVLDAALATTAGEMPRRGQSWVTLGSRGLRAPVVAQLVRGGLVEDRAVRVLGLVTGHRYPDRSPGPRAELLGRLHAAVLDGHDPDGRTAALAGLLHAAHLRLVVFPDAPRRRTEARLQELGAMPRTSRAVSAALAHVAAAAATAGAVAATG